MSANPQIRDTSVDPPFLLGENGQKFMYTMRIMLDLLLEKLNQGMRGHMPGAQVSPTLLPFMGNDRLMVQGPAESNASFETRLQRSFATWGYAGARRAVIEEITAFLRDSNTVVSAQLPEVLIVGGNSSTSTWDTSFSTTPLGSPPAHRDVAPPNWNWDGTYRRWWSWLVLFFTPVATGAAGTAASLAQLAWVPGFGENVAGVWVPSAASVADGPFVTVSGLSGLTQDDVLRYITFTAAASGVNNQTAQIVSVLSDSVCVAAMPSHVAPDANNGSIHWSISEYPIVAPGPVWGAPGAVWGDRNRSIGLNVVPEYAQSLRSILVQRKKAETYYPAIIFAFGDGADGRAGSMFSPLSSQGAGNPDGAWGSAGKNVGGVWVPARACTNPFDCFADGTGQYVQCSVHNVT